MLQKVKESSIAAAMKASNVRVVDPAEPPKYPYKPSTKMNAALGLFGGCFLGIAFIVMRERADRTFQAPGDAAYWLKLPELGVIPSANVASKRRLYYRPKALAAAVGAASTLPAKVASPDCVELASVQHKDSVVAESFRGVLTSLMFTGQNGSRPRVLVMTSSGPAEGKTTVASNLAIALAEIGTRVLLIDADMRKPRIHDIFSVDNEIGLSTLLEQRAPMQDSVVVPFIRETSLPGLNVLPSGPPTSSATTLLYSPRLAELLRYVRREYDMVIVDTPPMSQMPDARVAARVADGVVLILRSAKTTRDVAIAIQERLSQDRTRVIGTILNDWDTRNSSGSYYGYDNYNGYYRIHYCPSGNGGHDET